jgi:hypothetical protein
MRHVNHQVGINFVGDFFEFSKVDLAWVGGGAGQD